MGFGGGGFGGSNQAASASSSSSSSCDIHPSAGLSSIRLDSLLDGPPPELVGVVVMLWLARHGVVVWAHVDAATTAIDCSLPQPPFMHTFTHIRTHTFTHIHTHTFTHNSAVQHTFLLCCTRYLLAWLVGPLDSSTYRCPSLSCQSPPARHCHATCPVSTSRPPPSHAAALHSLLKVMSRLTVREMRLQQQSTLPSKRWARHACVAPCSSNSAASCPSMFHRFLSHCYISYM
jgi:hypothetical protein